MSSTDDRLDRIVGIWWVDRDPLDMARSSVAFVEAIRGLHPLLAEWFVPTGRRASSLQNRFALDSPPDAVAESAMWDPKVLDHPPIFKFDLWNGRDDWSSAAVSVTGVLSISAPPPARATLKLPAEVPQGAVRAAFRALVDAFHPELAGLAADASKAELLAGRAPGPLVYLSAGRYRRPRSAPDTVVEAVGTHGWLLEAGDWALTMDSALRDSLAARLSVLIAR